MLFRSYKILIRVYSDGAHLKIALAEEKTDENFRARTVKIVYGVLENDAYLSLCIKTFAEKSPKQSVRVVLKIALYAMLYLEKPRYAVTNDAAELLKKNRKGRNGRVRKRIFADIREGKSLYSRRC